jgi:hypothetical protein
MIQKRKTNLRARAIRAGAKSAEDFELFEYLSADRKAMRTSAREDEADKWPAT